MRIRGMAIAVISCVVIALSLGCDKQASNLDPKEAELEALPVGMEVVHTPNPVRAQENTWTHFKYTWLHKTSVKSLGGPLKMQEFGALTWVDGRWVFGTMTGKPFTADNFVNWYNCPDARLEPNQEYVDPRNWEANLNLVAAKSKFYFIATNEKGERVKGEAIVEDLPEEMAKTPPTTEPATAPGQ